MSSNILISIVNYRTRMLTLECVESLRPALAQFPEARLTIVDNGSGDDSVAKLHASQTIKALGKRVEILACPNNGGYAVGNNAALRPALAAANPPDYYWLLNSDTRTEPDALAALLEFINTHPRVGLAGSRLQAEDGTVQRSAFRFPTILGEWESSVRWGWMTRLCARWVIAPLAPATATPTEWVPGASMFIRRQVLEQIGLLDEKFFMYYEDVDFCLRAREAGWETWYVPASRVQHRVGASSGITRERPMQTRTPSYWFAARRHYFQKHHGGMYTVGADSAWLLGFALVRVKSILQRKPLSDPPHLWRDFFANSIGMQGEM